MATVLQCTLVISHTPGTAKSKGDVIVTTSRVGVAMRDIPANVAGELCVEGVVSFPKSTSGGSAIADGVGVYWNAGSSIVSTSSGDGLPLGVTVGASADADATQTVRFSSTYVTPVVSPASSGLLVGMNGNAATNANAVNMNSNGNLGSTFMNFSDVVRTLKQANLYPQ